VPYKLNLPSGSLIHPVFHVSQIKKCKRSVREVTAQLPVLGPKGKGRIEPLAILDRRILKKNNQVPVEVLIKWSNLDEEEAIWEDYEYIYDQFPNFKLKDKLSLKPGELLGSEMAPEEKKKLVIIGVRFKFKNNGSNTTEGIKGAQTVNEFGPIRKEEIGPVKLMLSVEMDCNVKIATKDPKTNNISY
jgi:Chromo (CHRromatin Organisation MOdifier) domain